METKKPVILHIIDTTGPGGAETVFTQLAQATQQKKYPTIALIRGSGWVEDQLSKLGIKTLVKNCKGSFNVSYLFYLIKLIRKEKISIIQSHLLGSNVYASLAGLLTFTPVISTFHGSVDVSPKEKFRFFKFLLIRLGSKHIVAVSKQIKDLLLNMNVSGIKSKTRIIANGIDDEKFQRTQQFKLDKKQITIGCLGNVRPAKNYNLAVDFVASMQQSDIDIKLKIAGDNTNQLSEELNKKILELKLTNNIQLIGFIDSPEKFLSDIDVFLMTSSSEGHPLAITQALANEIPVVTTPSGVEDIISDDIIFISQEHSSKSLKDTFIQMLKLSEEELLERLRKGRKLVADQYSLSAMLKQYFNLWMLK